ncbi:MAG: hypothetical protein AB2689_25805 [Candidatus Thiodiazotropha taylori]
MWPFKTQEETDEAHSNRRQLLKAGITGAGIYVVDRITGGILKDAHARDDINWSHELYEILWNNVDRYTVDKHDREALRRAIYSINEGSFKAAGFILIPDYDPNFSHRVTNNLSRMKNPGGNNPVYWTALRIASDGVGDPINYHSLFNPKYHNSTNPSLPTNPQILEYAKHISPANLKGIVIRLDKYPEFRKLFY